MPFCTVTFLLIFLPASLALYFIVPGKLKNFVMLTESLLFYAWGAPVYVILLIFIIALDYFCALRIEGRKDVPMLARRAFIFAAAANVFPLLFFRYHGFFITALNSFLNREIPYRALPFPMGILFYILQSISYLADVYKQKEAPLKNPIDLALYISMFPTIVSGPIVRYADIAEQLSSRTASARKFGAGAAQFITGFACTAVLSGGMAEIFEEAARIRPGGLSVLTAWVGCVSFAFAVYFYFSGYSDMALGLAKMFGFELRRNFDYPYTASSVFGFWTRWNISLVTWFRRYVYAPLGKSRFGKSHGVLDIFIIWALIGMWHGGRLNFLLWGLYHGMLLALEKFIFKRALKKISRPARRFFTLILIAVGWVFYFSPGIGPAFIYLGEMFGIGVSGVIDAQGIFFISSNWLLFVAAVLCSGGAGKKLFRAAYLSFKSQRAQKIAAAALYICCFLVSMAFLLGRAPGMYSDLGFWVGI